ncbi:MAG: cellulose biosynthesis cyclic di-GMP-binding regulatory protein BcsB [Legionella sp.]|nr:cellulose biosynthesis cyclic di-GMP-binding regulatory protein BcsB [Legionella sp.]
MILLNRALGLLFCFILPLTGEAQLSGSALNSQSVVPVSQANSTSSYTFKQFGWDGAVTLNGYQPETTLYLPLAKRLNIQKIVLHLTMTFSPKLTEGSKVDIKFNQTLITSLSLPTDANKEVTVDVELPVTQLSESWQELNFSAFLMSNINLCNPDIWIYISPESTITIDSINQAFNGTLNDLPYPFTELTALSPISTHLLLPENPKLEEISSLMQMAFKLGDKISDAKGNISSGIINAASEKLQNSNLILVGTLPHILENTSAEFKNLVQIDEISAHSKDDNGMLLLNQSPFNPLRGLLIVSGSNEVALNKATKAFLTDEFTALASGKLALVNTIETPEIKMPGEFYETTLKDLGYDDKSVSGLGRHRMSFNISLPNDRIPDYSSIKTFITTPIFNKEGLSQITLLVNDQKQGTFWISKEHSGWSATIDSSAMKPGLNKLDYLIDLHFKDRADESCSRASYDDVWATIHSETKASFSFSNKFPFAMLNQLPVPFAKEVTIILPEQLTNEDINIFSKLFFKLGQLFKLSPVNMNVLGSNEVTEEFIRNNNVIILGTAETNPWVRYTLDYMPVQLKGKMRYLKFTEQQLELSGENSTGLVELMPSPWSEKHAVLLITSDNKQGLHNSINTLVDDKERSKLNGNIAFINQDHTVETLNSSDNRYISPTHRVLIYLRNLGKNIYYYFFHHPQAFIYILVFLVPLIIVWRRRRKRKL